MLPLMRAFAGSGTLIRMVTGIVTSREPTRMFIFRIAAIVVLCSTCSAADTDGDRHATIQITRGRGTPVCEAYAQLLNQALLDPNRDPDNSDLFCSRPEGRGESGFQQLEKHDLSAPEIVSLFRVVHAFMTYDDQKHYDGLADQEV